MPITRDTDTTFNQACYENETLRLEDCEHCALRQRMLFSKLEFGNLTEYLWPIQHTKCPSGTMLYHQGQPAHSILSVRMGFIKLVSYSESGDQQIVRILGPGDCGGIEALLEPTYHHQAVALSDVDLCVIPIKIIHKLQKDQPDLSNALIQQWHEQLFRADNWLANLRSGPLIKRVINLVLMLHELQKLPGNQIQLVSNQDIAAIVAGREETVSRCLSELRKERLITLQEKRQCELDITGLRARLNSDG
ncbi:Global nitrogen regulator [BD1-7 clade bacterium]|uniref:Global nitrogen regulator n=1 Tax=BD1-7 clade bacterium TaxID=2029982 RepID=A0A5S9PIP9_9GAMM|nr:Global nitrogen regulator [BD1-7 clade bacterium]